MARSAAGEGDFPETEFLENPPHPDPLPAGEEREQTERWERERTEFAAPDCITLPGAGTGDQAARGRTSRWIFPPVSRRALVKSYIACKFIQNSGLVPKNRASRNAVSAVTDRSPLTIAPMRVVGTRKAIASAFTDMPSGRRNSPLSTSPG